MATGAVAIDAEAATSALVLVAGPDGYAISEVPIADVVTVADLTRPLARLTAAGHRDRRHRRAAVDESEVAAWRSLGLAVGVRRSRRHHARGARAGVRLRARTPAVRGRHRLVPGRPAPPGGRVRRHRGIAQHCTARGMGGRRPAGLRGLGRGLGGQGLLRRGRPARSARPPFRCTAASATPGTASPMSSCGGPSCPPRCSAVSGTTWPACWPPTASRSAMDFADSDEELAFRLRLRDWLADNNPGLPPSSTADEYWAGQAAWHRTLYDAGFFGLSWPSEIGGHELPSVYEVILDEELTTAGAPPRPSVGYLVQGILRHGSDDVQRRFLPGLVSGRERWCQGFSEPDAGSDLAVAPHTRRAPRQRVRDHRPQGVDQLLGRGRLVPGARPHRSRRAQAPGDLRLRRPDAPAGHRAAAAQDDQRDHAGVRRGPLRRRPGGRGEHDRRSGRGLAARHDRGQPRARAGRARLCRPLRQARQRAGRCRQGGPRRVRVGGSSETWRGRSSRPRCCGAT